MPISDINHAKHAIHIDIVQLKVSSRPKVPTIAYDKYLLEIVRSVITYILLFHLFGMSSDQLSDPPTFASNFYLSLNTTAYTVFTLRNKVAVNNLLYNRTINVG